MERLNEGTKEAKKPCPCCGRMLPPSEWCTADEEESVVFEVLVDGKHEGTITLAELYDSDIDQCESEGVLRELDDAEVGAVVRCGGGAIPVFEYRRVS